MNSVQIRRNIFALLAILMISYACSKNEPDPSINPDAGSIDSLISQIPQWKAENVTEIPAEKIGDVMVPTESVPYKCGTYQKNLVKKFDAITCVGTNFGVIWPGVLIQGKTLADGELKPINIKRAPVTIQINIPLNETSKKVDEPNSVNIQQAIADFQVAAGQMPEGSQAGAGLMYFSSEEAASFEQSMLAMGITGGFTDPESQIGLDASANVSAERSYREHTVIAKFVQEMFTVRLADDLLQEPSEFFAPDVTLDDVMELKNKGVIGADNIPLYIESVTYGRMLLFTMKSTEVSSAQELSAALQASMDDYVHLGGSLSSTQRQILENSTTMIFSAGGTKEAANLAIAHLDWSEFFKAAPASTAVPISFKAKTLNGGKLVEIVGNVNYIQRDNCQAPSSYDITVTWTNNDFTGICNNVTCPQQVWVKKETATTPALLTPANEYKHLMHFTPEDIMTQTGRQFTIKSYVEIYGLGIIFTKTQETTHDVTALVTGNNPVSHTVSNAAGSVNLDFVIRKVANY